MNSLMRDYEARHVPKLKIRMSWGSKVMCLLLLTATTILAHSLDEEAGLLGVSEQVLLLTNRTVVVFIFKLW